MGTSCNFLSAFFYSIQIIERGRLIANEHSSAADKLHFCWRPSMSCARFVHSNPNEPGCHKYVQKPVPKVEIPMDDSEILTDKNRNNTKFHELGRTAKMVIYSLFD